MSTTTTTPEKNLQYLPSPVLSSGIQYYYSLVAVIYPTPNDFVTQFRCKGRWFNYDCMQRSDITTFSTEFNNYYRYLGFQHMFVVSICGRRLIDYYQGMVIDCYQGMVIDYYQGMVLHIPQPYKPDQLLDKRLQCN